MRPAIRSIGAKAAGRGSVTAWVDGILPTMVPPRRVTRCRTCDAQIVWAVSTSDRAIPMDAAPAEDGQFVIVEGVARPPELWDPPDLPRYRSHFVTCPDADRHRKVKARPRG